MEAGSKHFSSIGHCPGQKEISILSRPLKYLNYLLGIASTSKEFSCAYKKSIHTILSVLLFSCLCLSTNLFAQSSQVFSASGTYTVPAGVTIVTVECWGAGGAGGGNNSINGTGGGGGGGAYTKATNVAVVPNSTYAITVGAGGVPGVNSGNGNISSAVLGSTISANAGAGGSFSANGIGGSGGSSGTYNGGSGSNGVTGNYGGGGGGSAGTASNGNSVLNSATGATSVAGGGPGGNGRSGSNGNGSAPVSGPGGGGGGCRAGGTARTAGNGSAGQVVISWSCPVYSLTGTSATSICTGNVSVVTLSSTSLGLPVGIYTITYSLTGSNTASGVTTALTVNTAGTGIFNTLILPNQGTTTIIITNISSAGCNNAISSGNSANIIVTAIPAVPTLSPSFACQGTVPVFTAGNGLYFEFFLNGISQGVPSASNTWTPSIALSAGNLICVKSYTSLSIPDCFSQTCITVESNHTILLTSALSTINQVLCPSIQIVNITYQLGGGATNATVSGLPAGVTGNYSGGVYTLSGTPVIPGVYNYTVLSLGNSCIAASSAGTITVLPATPGIPGSVSGLTSVCLSATGLIYSIAAVPSATVYTWTVPSGWTITSGQGTLSITVATGAAGQSGNITVSAGNSCGTSAVSTLVVNVITPPVQTGAIAPPTPNVCQNSIQNYMVNPPPPTGVTYMWSGPPGSTILSGQGTQIIQIRYGNLSGTLSVTPSNSCGNGTPQTMAVTVLTSVPSQPGIISGLVAPCAGTTQIYSVASVSGITYTWSLPSGWTITSGQGTNSITTVVGTLAGNIQVIAGNACGSGAPRLIVATPQSAVPGQPSPVSGSNNVCLGSIQNYSVTNTPFVVYTWSVPAGWTINSGQGTSTVSLTAGVTSGNIVCTPSNECGAGVPWSLGVIVDIGLPSDPGSPSGNINPCENSLQVYSVVAQAGISYSWVVPAGSVITSGQGTSSVAVTIGAISGAIDVTPINSCGTGPQRLLNIIVSPLPSPAGVITGSVLFCEGSVESYSVVNTPGNTYNWSVPAGWTISVGQGTSSITVNSGVNSGNVQVTPLNSCGAGPPSILAVVINPLPSAFAGDEKVICTGASIQIGGSSVPGNTYTWISIPTGFTSAISNPVVKPDTTTTYILVETNPATGCSNTHSVKVIANQVIDVYITPSNQTICTGGATSIVLASNISYTTYTWIPVLTSGSGTTGFLPGSGPSIAQVITNSSSVSAVVTYNITAMADECANKEKTVEITIDPAPLISGAATSVCSDMPSNLVFGASTNGVSAATYNITSIQSNGLVASAGSPSTGTGFSANIIADDAWTNLTTSAVHVIYTVVPVSSQGCSGVSAMIDITVNPKPVMTSQAIMQICSGASTGINLTSNIPSAYSWIPGAITGGITGASAGNGNSINQVLTNPGNATPGTVEYIVTPVSTSGSCSGMPFSIVVTVNPIPVMMNSGLLRICSGANTNLVLTSSTPSLYSWTIGTITGTITGASAGSGSAINQFLTNSSNASSGTVQYIVASTSVVGGCASSPYSIIVTVDPIPSVSAGANTAQVCQGFPFNLTSSSSLTWAPSILLSENFNAATNSWISSHNSNGGTPANSIWTLRPNGYTYGGLTFRSNDNTQFYLSNSDAQGGGGGTRTRTYLKSPVINASGFISLSLEFYHYFFYDNNSHGYVQVSTNGTTWVNVADITNTQGTANNFAFRSIDLSAYAGSTTLYIQFYFYAERGFYWAIDNVTLRGTSTSVIPIISWSSNPAGFTSSDPNPANISQAETTVYTASYTNPISGCSNSASTTVTTLQPPVATITADYCAVPGKIELTASGGGTYFWSTGQSSQVIVVDVAGIFSVTVTGSNGCVSIANLNISQELVVNGTFSAGNSGFTSGYIYDPAANGLVAPESEYSVYRNAQFTHTNFWGYDHTSGTGTGNANFMIINGAKYAPQPTVWEETTSVLANTDYYFSAWSMSLNNVAPFAKLRFEVNGVQLGTTASLTAGVNNINNPWLIKDRFYGTWNSGAATTATIRIIDLETAAGGNDFGIDDISFGTLSPLPFTFSPSGNNGTNWVCEGQTLQLNANIVGGMPPYHTSWTGPNGFTSVLQDPVIPNIQIAGQGTYILTMYDSYGCTPQTKSVYITVNPAPTAIVTSSGSYCQYSASPLIIFTANGGTAPYTFTYNINGEANQVITTFGASNTAIVFAPTINLGSYTFNLVSVIDDKGCWRIINSSITAIVNPLPVSAISGDSQVCVGSTGNIYTGNAGMTSYAWWISGNGSISGVNNNISVDVTAGNSCGNSFILDLEVTDANGCSAVSEETVMVDDGVDPIIQSCPPATTFIGMDVSVISPLIYSETPVFITGTSFSLEGGIATDNCVIDTYSYSDTQAGTSPVIVTRTFTITDKCGNIATCIQIITINNLPDITCSNPISVNTSAGLCTAIVDPPVPAVNIGGPVIWTWIMSGATTASGTGAIGNYTFNVGVTTITWTATNISGFDTCNQLITVTDNEPPVFTVLPKIFCVFSIDTAIYYDPTIDIQPTRPDYYTFKPGDTTLDITGLTDNCCAPSDMVIHWRIDFMPTPNPLPPYSLVNTPSISGTGQPSAYGTNIQLPGDGVTFLDVIHTITYWIVDCHNNITAETTVNITIKPRPNVIKL